MSNIITITTREQANAINNANGKAWANSDGKALGMRCPAPMVRGDLVVMLSNGQAYKALAQPRQSFAPADYDEQAVLDAIAAL